MYWGYIESLLQWLYENNCIANNNIIRQIPKNLYKSEVTDYEVKIPKDMQLDSILKNSRRKK